MRSARRGAHAHPSRPALIVEVADSKASLYARARVPEYWIVDLVHDAIDVHREPEPAPGVPHGWRYRSVETLRVPAAVTPLVAPDNPIPVADLLP